MNIFVSDLCPVKSAIALDDKRVVKMTLESAQLLCTVLGKGYSPTHVNHPCTKWAAASPSNTYWLYRHFLALAAEYFFRYGKKHASYEVIATIDKPLREMADVPPPHLFIVCPGSDGISDPTHLYRSILAAKWRTDKRPPRWTKRNPPTWIMLHERAKAPTDNMDFSGRAL